MQVLDVWRTARITAPSLDCYIVLCVLNSVLGGPQGPKAEMQPEIVSGSAPSAAMFLLPTMSGCLSILQLYNGLVVLLHHIVCVAQLSA